MRTRWVRFRVYQNVLELCKHYFFLPPPLQPIAPSFLNEKLLSQ